MDFEFDPEKDRRNQALHGLSLALAAELDWDAALVFVDSRFRYNETRMIALAPRGDRLYYVAFADRNTTCRVISLGLALSKEVKHYVQTCT